MLDAVDADHVSNSAEEWEKVVVKLRSRAMPPPGARRPDNATYDRVATWLETELDRAAAAHVNPGRPAGLHRLNRIEYGNAIRDLLGVEIDPKAMLPADEQAHGFSTNADALSIQPALLDRYLAAAAKIARLAVGDPTMPAGFERYTALKDNSNESTWLSQNERLGEEFPLGSRGGIRGAATISRSTASTSSRFAWTEPTPASFAAFSGATTSKFASTECASVSCRSAARRSLRPAASVRTAMTSMPSALLRPPTIAWRCGRRSRRACGRRSRRSSSPTTSHLEGLGPDTLPIWSREHTNKPDNPLMISALLIGGPYGGRVSPESPSRRRLFVCQPASSRDETACATRILTDAGAARVSPPADERRHPDAGRLLSSRTGPGRLRRRDSRRYRASPRESGFPVPD